MIVLFDCILVGNIRIGVVCSQDILLNKTYGQTEKERFQDWSSSWHPAFVFYIPKSSTLKNRLANISFISAIGAS